MAAVKRFITLGLQVTNTLAYQGVQCCNKKFYGIRLRSDKHASLSRCFNAEVRSFITLGLDATNTLAYQGV
jgi:hypothetical protein